MIGPVVVVPSTPLALPGQPGRVHAEIATLRDQIERAADELAGQSLILIVAGGPAGSDVGVRLPMATQDQLATLRRAYGVPARSSGRTAGPSTPTREGTSADRGVSGRLDDPDAPAAEQVAHALLTALRDESSVAGVELDGDSAGEAAAGWVDALVLLAHTRRAAPAADVILLRIPSDIDAAAAQRLGQAAAHLTSADPLPVVVAGDLSAGHGPKPPRPGADITLDEHVVAALDGGGPDRLLTLDPDLTAASHARAAGALRVLGAMLSTPISTPISTPTGTPTGTAAVGTVVRWSGAPLGVGYVVAVGR